MPGAADLSGYTPLFSSLTTGTLCGRWPDIGLWPIVLSLSDWRGIVDVTPDYLSRVTGLPIGEVEACMKRFCEPDLYSRSGAEDGRRLVLLDEHRPWGWRIVNLKIYRNRASGQDQIEDGRNAVKVKRYKEKKKDTAGHRGTPEKQPDTYSYSDSYPNSDSNKNPDTTAAVRPTDTPEFDEFKAVYPKRSGSQPWGRALKAIDARRKLGEAWAAILAGAGRYAQFIRATGKEGSEFVMQAATFCGPEKHYLQPWHAPPKPMTAMERGLAKLNGEENGRVFEHEAESPEGLGGALRLLRGGAYP